MSLCCVDVSLLFLAICAILVRSSLVFGLAGPQGPSSSISSTISSTTSSSTSSIKSKDILIHKSRIEKHSCHRRDVLAMTMTMALLPSSTANAIVPKEDQDGDSDLDFFLRSLQPATKERPPITLPLSSQSSLKKKNKNINENLPPPTTIEALLSLGDGQRRPGFGEILTIQVWTGNDPPPLSSMEEQLQAQQLDKQTITSTSTSTSITTTKGQGSVPSKLLGGAKIPMARLRQFPVKVRLTSDNAISSSLSLSSTSTSTSTSTGNAKQDWIDALSTQDVWLVAFTDVDVNIDSGTNNYENNQGQTKVSFQEQQEQQQQQQQHSFVGTSLSKLLFVLPGENNTPTTLQAGLRPPISLVLRPNNE